MSLVGELVISFDIMIDERFDFSLSGSESSPFLLISSIEL